MPAGTRRVREDKIDKSKIIHGILCICSAFNYFDIFGGKNYNES